MRWCTIGALLLLLSLLGGCSTDVSDVVANECIAHWNDGGPRGAVAAEKYAKADVTASENKAGQWGCGFLFHSSPGEPWRIYAVIVHGAVIGTWDSAVGSSWGTDSPEGPIQVTLGVRSDGILDDS